MDTRRAPLLAGFMCDTRDAEVPDANPIKVTNPFDGSLVGFAPDLGADELKARIDALCSGQTGWAARTAGDRAGRLKAWHAAVLEREEELARLVTLEAGKPLAEARAEVRYAAAYIEWFAEEARRTYGEVIPGPWPGARLMTVRQPVGVVAAITPWNFPLAMITRKVAPALAAGCSVVLKPAEETPLSAMALQELALEAGIPGTVYTTFTSRDAAMFGDIVCDSPRIAKLTFTGSTRIGSLLLGKCAPTVKRVSLELGGNAPFIVFDDADLDAAVDGFVKAKFRNAGQTCVSPNRLLVQSGASSRFLERLMARLAGLRLGNGLAEGTDLGPLIAGSARSRLEALIEDARALGAQILRPCEGETATVMGPAIVLGATPDMRVVREEIFGPLIPLLTFAGEAEALQMANATDAGLAAYVYTRDQARVWRMSEGIEAGMIGINTGAISTEVAPFGGVKQSGLGREGGRQGMDDYLEIKYLAVSH
ncbi:NAD-dependent succinate-semialdehyde dehydrogenase [Stappia sp.]|uniref:NAD-dependent succinate-semialdehyde dehydrogenase n=1 Tax=Stappia sp. TaxID=1870903 RepID=UPI003A99A2C3